MSIFNYINFIFLFSLSISDQCDDFTTIPTKVNDCIGKLSESQIKDELKAHCCYSKSDNEVNPKCISLTEIQYHYVKEYIKFNEILWGDVNLNIDCNSSYLKIGILYILLILI